MIGKRFETAGDILALSTMAYAAVYYALGHSFDMDITNPTYETYNFYGIMGSLLISAGIRGLGIRLQNRT